MDGDNVPVVSTIAQRTPIKRARGGFVERPLDWYIEQPFVPYLVFQHSREKFHPRIWDPCCGRGTTPEEAIKAGYLTYATDIVDRGYRRFDGVRNFLTSKEPHPEADIVCNPPYYKGLSVTDFLKQANEATYQKVTFILRQDFLFGAGRWSKKQKRWVNIHDPECPTTYDLLTKFWRPKIVYFISNRPSMPPGGTIGEKPKSGSQDFVVIVWDKGFDGLVPGFDEPISLCDWLRLPDGMDKMYGLDPVTYELSMSS